MNRLLGLSRLMNKFFSTNSAITFLVLSLSLSLLVSACSFRAPNLAEQEELSKRGVFSNNRPAWVSGQSAGSQSAPASSFGFKNRFERNSSTNSNNEAYSSSSQLDSRGNKESDSPLDRLESMCPGMSAEAEAALLTDARKERVVKYEKILARCPGSLDIWLWAAKDYQSLGNTFKAEGAVLRALSIDSQNEAAKSLRDSIIESKTK